MNKQYLSKLKEFLLKEHEYAEKNIGKYINNIPMIDGNEGIYEWDRIQWTTKGLKYVALHKYIDCWENEYWQQAYKELVEENRLELFIDQSGHKKYRYIITFIPDYEKEVFKKVWNHGPHCPAELQKHDKEMKESDFWKQLKFKFLIEKMYEKDYNQDTTYILHHISDEAYEKVLNLYDAGVEDWLAYKPYLKLVSKEEHDKIHNY